MPIHISAHPQATVYAIAEKVRAFVFFILVTHPEEYNHSGCRHHQVTELGTHQHQHQRGELARNRDELYLKYIQFLPFICVLLAQLTHGPVLHLF